MMSTRRAAQLGLLGAFVVLAGTISVLIARTPQPTASVASVGRPAPRFVLADTSERPVSLESYSGKVVVLLFMSARSDARIGYQDPTQRWAQQLPRDERVQCLAIACDSGTCSPEALMELRVQARIKGRSFPTLVDNNIAVAQRYGIEELPSWAVIAPDGTLAYRSGSTREDEAQPEPAQAVAGVVRNLLNEMPVAVGSTQAFGPASGLR